MLAAMPGRLRPQSVAPRRLTSATNPQVWNVDISRGLTAFSTIGVALTFSLGSSVKSMFENLLFIFMQHPYDIGDVLVIEGEVGMSACGHGPALPGCRLPRAAG
jgi:hypothetical protein